MLLDVTCPRALTVQLSVHRLSSLPIATSFLTKKWLGSQDHYLPLVQRRRPLRCLGLRRRAVTCPDISDAPNLPCVQTIVKEVLRQRPALPLGLPHTSTEDDWYNGMFIPKGTLILTDLWNRNHESSSYGDDAKSFRPERFLDVSGEAIPGPAETHEDGHSTFGFGRRALFIYIAMALWVASFGRARDQDGKEVPIDTETFVDTGMTCLSHTNARLQLDFLRFSRYCQLRRSYVKHEHMVHEWTEEF